MRVNLSWSLAVLLSVSGAIAAQPAGAKKPFTIADLYRFHYVSDPQVSPDGERVAFVVTDYDLPKGERRGDVWIVGVDGSGARKLTGGAKSCGHPRWSPDGRRLLFTSSRGGSAQAWVLDMVGGGEARKVTDFAPGVTAPEWAGNERIVFSAYVFPEHGADGKANEKLSKAMAEGPIQAHMADRLLYRHWTFYLDGKRNHLFVADVKDGAVRELTPGDHDAPRFSLGGRGFAVSPDGKEVCFVSNHDPDPWSSTNGDLFVVSIDGGSPKNLTDGNDGFDGDPIYSPDGKSIAYVRQLTPRYEADRFRLCVLDRATGESRSLSDAFDYWVHDPQWSADGQTVYFTADHTGRIPLFRVPAAGGAIEEVARANTIGGYSLTPDGKSTVVMRKSIGAPSELWRKDFGGDPTQLVRLTTLNRALEDEVDIRPAEEMWFEGAGGKKVHCFVVKPHGFDPSKKYPLILNVHGGPQGMWADSFRGDWQVYPGAGYIVAFPNPTGSTGYGQKLTAAISRDWGGAVFEDLMKVTDALEKLPYVDADRMGAMGWSYGGYMMNWFEGHTKRFKCLASMMGVYDLRSMYSTTEELWFVEWDLGIPWEEPESYARFSPSNYVKNFSTPCLVIAGERDYRVPYTQSIQLFTDLQKMNVPSRLIVFKNDGHWPNYVKSMPLYYNAHLDWFHRWLGGGKAPWDMKKMVRNRAFEKE